MVMPIKDMAGQRYGALTVVAFSHSGRKMAAFWKCICDCGVEKSVSGQRLRRGYVKSCGCKKSEFIAEAKTEHGMTHTATYRTWTSMKARCNNPNYGCYGDYGGRGISVCERWMSFDNFFTDMGERPRGTTIDRYPDVDGNYEPGNCRWATRKEQDFNKRNTFYIEIDGERLSVSDWSERSGISTSLIRKRISEGGWPPRQAVGLEPRSRKSNKASQSQREPA